MSIKIAFPFFRHVYHVYHGAPTAFELSLLDADLEVHLYSVYQDSTDAVNEIGSLYPGHRVNIHVLPQLLAFRYFNIKRRPFPKPQKMIDKYADLFREMDVIIDTSDSMLRLISVHNITGPKYISAFHGAGDRQRINAERFNKFDYFLIAGPKRFRRMKESEMLTEDNWKFGGYPKLDIISRMNRSADSFFNETRPVVLYNPHFERKLSSWYRWGRKVLKYFSESSRYNLIFAPHVELKGRKNRFLSLKKYDRYPNIHVDLGSKHSIDMTYTSLADLYISDVSSQVVEYLYKPRPCIFLNAQGIEWENNPYYIQWHLGPVINDLGLLDSVLENALTGHEKYIEKQKNYCNDSIELTETPSAKRSAQAILEYINREKIGVLPIGRN